MIINWINANKRIEEEMNGRVNFVVVVGRVRKLN